MVHGEPLVIRTGTSSERWTLIRRKGFFGLWRGQGNVAEADREVAGEKKSARGWGQERLQRVGQGWDP